MSDNIKTTVCTKDSPIENEVDNTKTLLWTPERVVSLRGIAKSLVKIIFRKVAGSGLGEFRYTEDYR